MQKLTDQQLINQIKFMIEVERKTNRQCWQELGLKECQFRKLKEFIEIKIPCKKCGEIFIKKNRQKYCDKCGKSSDVWWRNVPSKQYEKTHNLGIYGGEREIEAKTPVYHQIPKLQVGDMVKIKVKRDGRRQAKEDGQSREYHIKSGKVVEVGNQYYLVQNDNGIREDIRFIDLKIGKYRLIPIEQSKDEHRAILNV